MITSPALSWLIFYLFIPLLYCSRPGPEPLNSTLWPKMEESNLLFLWSLHSVKACKMPLMLKCEVFYHHVFLKVKILFCGLIRSSVCSFTTLCKVNSFYTWSELWLVLHDVVWCFFPKTVVDKVMFLDMMLFLRNTVWFSRFFFVFQNRGKFCKYSETITDWKKPEVDPRRPLEELFFQRHSHLFLKQCTSCFFRWM